MVPQSILVIRGGAIGDFILTLPVFTALRARFPQARIEVLGYPHVASLAVECGLATAARPIESAALASFFSAFGVLDSGVGAYFARFELIVSYLYDPDKVFETNVRKLSAARFLAAPHRPGDTGTLHATETFLQPLERLSIFNADPAPKLEFPGDTHELLASGSWIALHPGSGSERKNWPKDRWQELCSHLIERTALQALLIGGEAEAPFVADLAKLWPSARVKTLVHQPLWNVARYLNRTRFYIGHDSGISHLAAAVGTRSLLLWGPSNPAIWAPRSPMVQLLECGTALADLPVHEVIQNLPAELVN